MRSNEIIFSKNGLQVNGRKKENAGQLHCEK